MGTLQQFSIGSFKLNVSYFSGSTSITAIPTQKSHSGQGHPDDTPAAEIEMTVKHPASYSSKKKQDLFTA
jgi:hypothetical protein